MKRYKLTILSLFIFLAACQSSDPVVTPPVVTAVSETTETTETTTQPATVAPATPETTETATEAPAVAPAAPTALPTATPSPAATAVPEQPVDQIQLQPIAGAGLNLPLYLTHAGDDRLFVVQQNGLIRIIENGTVLETPFLNIREQVGAQGNEQGLLSVAFHPEYQQNGHFYVNYTNLDFHTTVSRFQVRADDPQQADPASEKILLVIEQPFANHNGGLVTFGPDGYLYIGMGDGGSGGDPQNQAQNPQTLLGALLRIDVNVAEPYAIPADNPYVEDDNGRNEIWATGLRNPWRFSFDRQTNNLFIADVGQNMWEIVHFQPAGSRGGENYGWNILEGSHCYQTNNCRTEGLELPIFEYDHSQGCSITGGHVYRGSQFPELRGNYFLGDFCSGIIWRLFPRDDGTWESALLLDSDVDIASFGEDVNGELYLVSRSGTVFQIQP